MADQAPPEDVQNSNTGSAEGGAEVAPTFPDRLRVHALAKIIGVTSKQVLAKLGELGIEARSAQSSLGRDVAQTVHASFAEPEAVTPAAVEPAAVEPAAVEPAAVAPEAVEAQVAEPDVAEPDVAEPDVAEPQPAQTLFSTDVPAESAAADAAATDTAAPVARPTFSGPLFLQPEAVAEPPRARRRSKKAAGPAADSSAADANPNAADTQAVTATADASTEESEGTRPQATDSPGSKPASADAGIDETPSDATSSVDTSSEDGSDDGDADDDNSQPRRRRRGRRGRGRGRGDQAGDSSPDDSSSNDADDQGAGDQGADSDADDVAAPSEPSGSDSDTDSSDSEDESTEDDTAEDSKPTGERRSRRRSRSRGGAKSADDASAESGDDDVQDNGDASAESDSDDSDDEQDAADGSSRRRRRRRRRRSSGDASSDTASSEDDPPNTVVHEREPRTKSRNKDEVQGITGSTRLEAKRQRRRDGRDAGRRRPPILTESEFLARRESVDRVMVVREKSFPDHGDTTQVAVLEDGVLVEHFVTSSASASMVGNVYLGRVQNVLPSMEAAFIDIGRGRNGVLYAGEVNWDAAGLGGNSRKIEQALKPGDQVLVQVSKDPVGHKGARLTTQLSLAGRYLVYVPGGSSTGISRKLPDTERKRLKEILRDIVPSEAGVIIRTAAEGVSEEELARDVSRLQAQWASIEEASAKAESGKGSQPQTLYEEPDLLVKVIRDLFNEDFVKLVIEGDKAWSTTSTYIETVAADMLPKLERHVAEPGQLDVFEAHRIDEQLAKALDRKVWLPSGGTLVIDRTEAMTVVDVNTGKFTGAGGNLEETVTRNNLEAAEEVVRQMRLRDIGGMIVVDFIDMVLEQNRDLVLRRLTEALGRDRTRHQVSEVTSLGLVQMTRKKLGTGLVEAFSTTCEHCQGRGIIVHPFPVEAKPDDGARSGSSRGDSGSQRKRRGRDKSDNSGSNGNAGSNGNGTGNGHSHGSDHSEPTAEPAVKRAHPVALAMAAHHDEVVADVTPADVVEHDASASTENKVIDASDVAAVQGNDDASVSDVAVSDVAVSDASVSDVAVSDASVSDAGALQESQSNGTEAAPTGSSRRGGRGARRKASRPTASAVVEDTGAAEAAESTTHVDAETPSSEAATDRPAAEEAAPEPAVAESVAADEPAASEAPVKAKRGRRVARKAAAPTETGPDAGAVFVISATSDGTDAADEPAPEPVTTPAFAQVDAGDVSEELPVARPRRRRSAARPAGPPVDA
ncbi:translation initiation factor IF-2 N-terminal domain-containing protein [Rhodococcus sp. 14-2470-1a]|uniref:translation initiation factor IF-2 N-terminal domain-containing protein n=1 Tax=Rhodococcus sp. 14-2470-1a TaxID=2023150 RepID=UPI000B9B3D1C|nr:translation initiation factor IF-2 N-terminal domain-containing protein [Rhodococcus sp. 14-2470-1a]OZF47444.1 ribonuclease E [Rhodococcus sp. 14-2470-1a]